MSDGIRVMAIKPFWRYAVIPAYLQNREPAMPFYTKKAALEFIEEMKADCQPVLEIEMLLFRKVWFRKIEEVKYEITVPEL